MSGLISKNKVIKKEGLNLNKVKEELEYLCDDDFNGVNGDEYCTEILDADGNVTLISDLDAALERANSNPAINNSFAEMIKYVLEVNYGEQNGYERNIFVADLSDAIVVSVNYVSYN